METGTLGGGFSSFLAGAAALFVIFWLLATLSSFIVEFFSSIFNIRGNALRLFTIDILQGELKLKDQSVKEKVKNRFGRFPRDSFFNWGKVNIADESLKDFSKKFFKHPLLRALEQPKTWRGRANTAPAYVPSAIFAKTVLDMLLHPAGSARFPATVAGVTSALDNVAIPAALRGALRPLVDAANHDMDRLSNEIAIWYDASMQRATGWYKRYTTLWLAIVGLSFAVLFNVDTPRIVAGLIASPSLRESGYAAALQIVGTGDTKRDQARREAMPQQIAFARAFDRICSTGSPLEASEEKIVCPKPREGEKSPPTLPEMHRQLLPLTIQSGASGEVLALIAMRRRGSERTFARQLESYCEGKDSCSSALKSAVAHYLQAVAEEPAAIAAAEKNQADAKAVLNSTPMSDPKRAAAQAAMTRADAALTEAKAVVPASSAILNEILVNDTGLFWYPGIAEAVLKDAGRNCEAESCWKPQTLLSARLAAEASAGALIGYARQVPGIGPVLTVSEEEKWEFCSRAMVYRILGWILTAMLVSLGAPFWFDLLQQIVNSRGTGPKPEEAVAPPVA